MRLLFIIPFVSRRYARNWDKACDFLRRTLASASNQSLSDFHILVVCGQRPEFLDKIDQLTCVETDFEIEKPQVYFHRTFDKMKKLHVGLVESHKLAPSHIMLLDADDLLSRRLVAFVGANAQLDGFILHKGFRYSQGSRYLVPSYQFHMNCGSSYVFRASKAELPSQHVSFTETDFLDYWMIKSHNKYPDKDFDRLGFKWTYVPFPAAVYRKGHQNESGVGNAEFRSFRKSRFHKWGLLREPVKDVLKLIMRKRIDDKLRREFMGL